MEIMYRFLHLHFLPLVSCVLQFEKCWPNLCALHTDKKRFYLQCKLLILFWCCIKKPGKQQGTKWGFNPFYHYSTEQARFCKVLKKNQTLRHWTNLCSEPQCMQHGRKYKRLQWKGIRNQKSSSYCILLPKTAEPHLGTNKLNIKLNCLTTVGHKLEDFSLGRKSLWYAETKRTASPFNNSRNLPSFWTTRTASQSRFWMLYWETHRTRLAVGLIFFVSTFFSAVNLLTDCWATLILKQNT